jgi:hypothetical protein
METEQDEREGLLRRYAHIFARRPDLLKELSKDRPSAAMAQALVAAEVELNADRRASRKKGSKGKKEKSRSSGGDSPQAGASNQASSGGSSNSLSDKQFEARLTQLMKVYENRVSTLEKKHGKHLKHVEDRMKAMEAIQLKLLEQNHILKEQAQQNLQLAALVVRRLPPALGDLGLSGDVDLEEELEREKKAIQDEADESGSGYSSGASYGYSSDEEEKA